MFPHGTIPPLPRSVATGNEAAVAVVIRTKNRALLLRRACESVLAQRFANWHLVVVNDGGAVDDVMSAVDPLRSLFGDRLTLVHNPTSLGMEAASNVGVRQSQSRYVVIHDDDDTWNPDFLFECVQYLDSDAHGQRCAGVATLTLLVREEIAEGRIVEVGTEPFNPTQTNISLFRMAGGNTFTNNSFLFRRSVYDAVGGFNEALPVLGDWDFNIRVLSRWEIGLIPKQLANYHHRINLQQTSYGNTVIGGAKSHFDLDAVVRNQLLRRDLADDNRYLGLVMNLSQSVQALTRNLDSLHWKMDAQANRFQQLQDELASVQHILWSMGLVLKPVRFGWHAVKPLGSRLRSILKWNR